MRALLAGPLLLVACTPAGEGRTEYQYVTSGVVVPTTSGEVMDFGFDLDGDANGLVDNQLGHIAAALDLELQPLVDDYLAGGSLIVLHSLSAADLEKDRAATWQLWLGDDVSGPVFDGSETFSVSAESPTEFHMNAVVDAGHVQAESDLIEIAIRLSEDQPLIRLHPIATHLAVDVSEDGCTGSLGGALSIWEINDVILPAVADMMGEDPDTLRENEIIQSLFNPDVDLLAIDPETQQLGRGQDGLADALSFGIGVRCVRAAFTSPQ